MVMEWLRWVPVKGPFAETVGKTMTGVKDRDQGICRGHTARKGRRGALSCVQPDQCPLWPSGRKPAGPPGSQGRRGGRTGRAGRAVTFLQSAGAGGVPEPDPTGPSQPHAHGRALREAPALPEPQLRRLSDG